MAKELTLSSRDARTFPSSLKMMAAMPGAWAEEAAASITPEAMAETPTVEATLTETEAATRNLEDTRVTTEAIKAEVVVEEAAVVATTMTAATETIEATITTLVMAVATIMVAHQDGAEMKLLLVKTTTTRGTTMTISPVAPEEVPLSSLAEVETEVASLTLVEEEAMETVEVLVAITQQIRAVDSTPLATQTTLLLPTTMAASKEETMLLEARASTNKRTPMSPTTDPRPAVSPALCMSATSTRTQLTLPSRLSLALLNLMSR